MITMRCLKAKMRKTQEVEMTNREKTAWVFRSTLSPGPSPLLEGIAAPELHELP